jgi:hypothetical protein
MEIEVTCCPTSSQPLLSMVCYRCLLTFSYLQIANYYTDDLVERTTRSLQFGPPEDRDTESLKNWLNGNGCLARNEASYLTHDSDLVTLSPSSDNAIRRIQIWAVDALHNLLPKFRDV